MHRTRVPLQLLTLFLATACAAPKFDTEAESKALLARDAEWAQLASEGKDVEKILSYWSDDAVVIPQSEPIAEGKEAMRAFVTSSMQIPGFKIHWVSDKVTFSPDGKLAYMRATNETTVPGPTGELMTIHARAVTVWRKDADGQWRCVRDMWNDPPAATAK
jgi:ketosteroid isomerase-like protein